jgi:hypothetical protein
MPQENRTHGLSLADIQNISAETYFLGANRAGAAPHTIKNTKAGHRNIKIRRFHDNTPL